MVPAAFGPISVSYGVTKQQASYLTTSYTLLGGVTPLLITPFVNLWGRRPAYLVRERCPFLPHASVISPANMSF